MIKLVARNKEQPAWIPKFTEVGFEKTKIPPDVYKMLLLDYGREKFFMFDEVFSCSLMLTERIIRNKENKKSSLKSFKFTFLTQLRLMFDTDN